MTEWQYSRRWKQYVQSTGISCTAHQLRHSFATVMLDAGLDLKDRQAILGHSTAAMTQDVYTHIRDARREETARLLNEKVAHAK